MIRRSPIADLAERGGETIPVLIAGARHHVDIAGSATRPMRLRSEATDQHVLDTMRVQGRQDASRLELGVVSRHAAVRVRARR